VHRRSAAYGGAVVGWMVRKDFRLNNSGHGSPSLALDFAFAVMLRTPLFINYAIRTHDCAMEGSGGVTDVASGDSARTKGGFVPSGEGETRGGAVNPAIRLLTAAVVEDASLCDWGVEVRVMATSCGLVAPPLPVFPASTHGRQKPAYTLVAPWATQRELTTAHHEGNVGLPAGHARYFLGHRA
jgi:hypothetical protein